MSMTTSPRAILHSQPEAREFCLGSVAAIPLGEGRAFEVGGVTVAVFRQRDGAMYATQNHCPHRDGPLADGLIGCGTVICPLHAYQFDLQTGACANDSACAIRTYPVRQQDGRLFVVVSAEEPR